MTIGAVTSNNDGKELGSKTKNRTRFRKVMEDCVSTNGIDLLSNVLIVGGSYEDADILRYIGFRRMTLTNLQDLDDFSFPPMEGVELCTLSADVENMHIADDSYDLVLAHEMLHHCRSPHKGLLEMLRVSRKYVIFQEPNDSLLMRALVKYRFSFPFELPAVIFHKFVSGGVRNSCIPNYIYRWNTMEMYQTIASYIPEVEFNLYVRRYWDFNVDKDELALRTQTRIGSFIKVLGPGLLLACLHGFQNVANRMPWLRRQGNKFFGCIIKSEALKPWLVREGGRVVFNQSFRKR